MIIYYLINNHLFCDRLLIFKILGFINFFKSLRPLVQFIKILFLKVLGFKKSICLNIILILPLTFPIRIFSFYRFLVAGIFSVFRFWIHRIFRCCWCRWFRFRLVFCVGFVCTSTTCISSCLAATCVSTTSTSSASAPRFQCLIRYSQSLQTMSCLAESSCCYYLKFLIPTH